MLQNLKHKFLYQFSLITTKESQGFTLIELVVVFMLISALSAVALPNFLLQVGKARESEAKMILGTIARQQQVYHVEKKTFAPNVDLLDVKFGEKYHLMSVSPSGADFVKHQAIALNPTEQVRNFAVGVYFDNGLFNVTMCQSAGVGIAVDVGNTPSSPCTNNGEKIN